MITPIILETFTKEKIKNDIFSIVKLEYNDIDISCLSISAKDEDLISKNKEFSINLLKDKQTLIKYKILCIPNFDESIHIYVAFGDVKIEENVSGYYMKKCFIILKYNLDILKDDHSLPYTHSFGYSSYLSY